MSNTSHIDSTDVTSAMLNVPTLIAFLGDVAVNWIPALAILESYTEWYTKGVGAIVVTVNAYILFRKARMSRQEEREQE